MIQPLKAKSRENLGRIMNRYYEGNHAEAAKGKFVIWIAIIVPTELLKGFDVIVCTPESHSAMCAARKMSADQCEAGNVV